MKKTYLIIHGHFYQPPREDSYTGIMPIHESAKPFENWNEHIYRTCYLPNAYSRYLDPFGKIEDINNNYNSISINFGPTLLNWLCKTHPVFIEKLKEADTYNIKKTGHSNILAQGYNHTILPLDCTKTRQIQILWAIKDYEKRFGHVPEGFWCPECAINEQTIDLLADCGIKYTVLSPWQVRQIDSKPLDGTPAPCDRPFIIQGKKKNIVAFFYDPDFASGISFGHYLRNADTLYTKIQETIELRNKPELLHWATDGEIYGHHEPFGDMALSALIKKIENSENIELTNYGAFLENHPPKEIAYLSLGNDGLGSSWSCSHGVERWYKDCGCHTGGSDKWNQKWRTPLRNAFKWLENCAYDIYYNSCKKIFKNNNVADSLLEKYIDVVFGNVDVRSFILSFKKDNNQNLNENEIEELAIILDAMRCIFISFTSCGWFFNDIFGIEPRQNISYAMKAASQLQQFTGTKLQLKLMSILREAESNMATEETGETIAKKDLPNIPPFVTAAVFFKLNRTLANKKDYTEIYGFFKLESIQSNIIVVSNTRTLKQYTLKYKSETDLSINTFHISIKDTETNSVYHFSSDNISLSSLKLFSLWVEDDIISYLKDVPFEKIANNIEHYIIIMNSNKKILFNKVFIDNISLCIKAIKCKIKIENKNNTGYIDQIKKLSWFAQISGVKHCIDDIYEIFNYYINVFTDKIRKETLSEEEADFLLYVLTTAREEGFNPEITELQNVFYSVLLKKTKIKVNETILRDLSGALNFSIQTI